MTTYAVYHVTTLDIVARGLSIGAAVRLQNERGHCDYAICGAAGLAQIEAERARLDEVAQLAIAAGAELLAAERRDGADAWDETEVIEVTSSRDPRVRYTVALDGSRCSCPGFQFRGVCKHVRSMRAA